MTEESPRPRLLAASLAAAAAGALVLGLVQFVLLPAVARGLTNQQVRWLRIAVTEHPGWVMAGVLVLSLLLSLPVFLVALWVGRGRRRDG